MGRSHFLFYPRGLIPVGLFLTARNVKYIIFFLKLDKNNKICYYFKLDYCARVRDSALRTQKRAADGRGNVPRVFINFDLNFEIY